MTLTLIRYREYSQAVTVLEQINSIRRNYWTDRGYQNTGNYIYGQDVANAQTNLSYSPTTSWDIIRQTPDNPDHFYIIDPTQSFPSIASSINFLDGEFETINLIDWNQAWPNFDWNLEYIP